jgi:LmbE family N-acetylglucosaminyl deacetylase
MPAIPIPNIAWPAAMRLLVLAPHPDDFDEVAVTLRWFHERGHALRLLVVSGSSSGVLDSFLGTADRAAKAAAREAEQLDSLRLFGLGDEDVEFLRLAEDEDGAPLCDAEAEAVIGARLLEWRPEAVFMPHGNDTNVGHQRVYALFGRLAPDIAAFLARDPKTIASRLDLYLPFGEAEAQWKRALLRCHRSQEHRNRLWRGHGIDDRILDVNRAVALEIGCAEPYAEAFQWEGWELT